MTVIRKPYSRTRTPFFTEGESLTKQSHAKECDINCILGKYQKTGLLDHVNRHQGNYDDVTESVDFHTAMNTVISATESFNLLPAPIRKKFNNDPAAFLDFVSNPENLDEMVNLGLATKQETVIDQAPSDQAPASA